ncbi:immunoglobulin-like domain-containing protein [Listeria booriae]|uniref:immunoglobulin-like domain-containing protein n=1 Tax=Listeria booriae TaxID=1552123 RepID=UPI00162A6655|nr:immunoglobulin-like domain-containing protein [Listeria booriae]MBC2068598.1 DUF5011 domain-containing protein [Listeria booriae]
MLIKKIGAVSTALVVLAGASVPSYAAEQVNPASYATKAEAKLKNNALKSEVESPIKLVNGSFEEPQISRSNAMFDASEVPGWKTTATDNTIELQRNYNDFWKMDAADGEQWAELNANMNSALYQDIETTPGTKIRWKVSHRGRDGVDTAEVRFGAPNQSLQLMATMASDGTAWKEYQGTYTIPEGQTVTRFEFQAISTADGDLTRGNYLDNIVFSSPSNLVVTDSYDKASTPKGKQAKYNVNIANNGGMQAGDINLEIPLPATLKYVPSSVTINGTTTSDVTYNDATHTLSVHVNQIADGATTTVGIGVEGLTETNAAHISTSLEYHDLGFTDATYTANSTGANIAVTSNTAPVIAADDTSVKKGGSFDPMVGVTASDVEDGNLTSSISVTANDVDTSAVGTYHVTYSVTDSDGNTTTKTITVTVTSNDAPVIVASDQTIKKGKAFDVMAGVSASDLEDGDVTGGITVTANDVDTNTVGTYHVTYSVTDSDGNTTTKTITVTITSNDAPTFTTSDVYLKVGDKFNPYAGITASDTEDGDLTDRIDIESSDVDMTQPGTYAVEYSVTDSDNNTTKITRHVYVRTNDKPVIHASDQTFKAGASFDPLAGMSASDTEDGDITANVTVTANDVDANQAGTYHVTYSVTDSDDNTTTKTVTITVLTNEKPVITAADITQKAHRSVDPMAGVTASDLEDGDLTANIKIIANDINIDVPGEYHVTYSVLDSDGNETEKTITVTILSNDAPVIHGQDVTFKAGKAFDPIAGVTASDTEDGDITSAIEMTANDVNPDVAGVYHVTYSVTDSDGNTTEATYTVTVLTNEKPVIHATDQTLAYGQAFDPLAGVTAEDLEDGDLTGSIKVISNDVNPLQAGIYHVTYSVTDADGNETQITITVLVGAQPVDPVIPADPETPMHVTPAPVQMADPIVSSVSAPDPVRELPKTGDTDNTAQVITIGGLLALLGALFLRRKK